MLLLQYSPFGRAGEYRELAAPLSATEARRAVEIASSAQGSGSACGRHSLREAKMRKELEIIILPSGEVHIETQGMTGEACVQEVQPIQEALGHVKDRRLKGEFYQQDTSVQIEGTYPVRRRTSSSGPTARSR